MKQTMTWRFYQLREVWLHCDCYLGLSSLSNPHEDHPSPYQEEVFSICSAINQGAEEETILNNAQKDFVTKVISAVAC